MKTIFSIILMLISCSLFSQTIEEREYDLRSYQAGEGWGKKKNKALQLLEIDKFNEVAIDYIFEWYQKNDQVDSIEIFWENLILAYPNEALVYLRRVELAKYENLTRDKKIEYLEQAYRLDNKNKGVNYLLGKFNYELFLENNSPQRANKVIKYLENVCQIDDSYKAFLKTPLVQIAHYMKSSEKLAIYEKYPSRNAYFPVLPFANLKRKWKSDFSYNVFRQIDFKSFSSSGIESARSEIKWYSQYLAAFKEPIIYDTLTTTIYRFTWLRSFHQPIVIRLQIEDNEPTIYWKIGNDSARDEADDMTIDRSRILSQSEWDKVEKDLNLLKFWKMSTKDNDAFGLDGAQWILEGLKDGKYHVVDRWSGGKIKPFCLQLLKLTSLTIKEKDIY